MPTNFSAFFETQSFSAVFTTAAYWPLFCATKFRLHLSVLLGTHFNNILLPLFHTFKWPLTSCFFTKKVCVFLLSHSRHVPLPSEPPHFIARVRFDEDKTLSSSLLLFYSLLGLIFSYVFHVNFYLYRSMLG
jgi:hypothetical protein